MAQIFISYSRRDKTFVDELVHDLTDTGYDIWLDREDIVGGESWRTSIVEGISSCSAFVLIVSPHSVASENVAKEVSLAEKYKKVIIPVIHQECEIPKNMEYQLAMAQQVSMDDYQRGFRQLVRALEKSAGTETQTPPHRPAVQETPPPPRQQPPTQPQPANLVQILPGTWQVQIGNPMGMVVAQLTLQIFPNHVFQGQMVNAMGAVTNIGGQWQVNLPMNQLSLQGQETNGYQTMPYNAYLQFTQVSPAQLAAVGAVGEQTLWQRMA